MIEIVLIIMLVPILINLLLLEKIHSFNNKLSNRIITKNSLITKFNQININFLSHKCKYKKVKNLNMDKDLKLMEK
jgi:hypothetical protein